MLETTVTPYEVASDDYEFELALAERPSPELALLEKTASEAAAASIVSTLEEATGEAAECLAIVEHRTAERWETRVISSVGGRELAPIPIASMYAHGGAMRAARFHPEDFLRRQVGWKLAALCGGE